ALEYRLGDGESDGCRRTHVGEEVEHRLQYGLDHRGGEAAVAARDVAGDVGISHQLDGVDEAGHTLLAGEHGHGMYLAGRQTDLGECRLRLPGQLGKAVELVGHIRLAAEHVPGGDGHVAPELRIDD